MSTPGYACDVGYALLYLNVIGLGSRVWVSSVFKTSTSPPNGVVSMQRPPWGTKIIVVVVVVVECCCFLINIIVEPGHSATPVSSRQNAMFC